ncbi:MAG: RDD family protein [Acidobacteria bacterium]|nr:RDD family protein [Acidobacteriota bacterium]
MTTFDSYLEQVLDRIPRHLPLRDQVAQDLRSTFADRQARGEGADEAIRQLGDPTALAESYLSAVPMRPAPFMARVGAKLVDALLYGMALPIPAIVLLRMTFTGTNTGPRTIAVVLILGLIGMGFWLLSAAAETRYGRTPGKKLMGLHVVRESGRRIGFGQAIVRQLPMFLNIFWIDALFALFTERHQRAFELLSRTRTVRDA